MPIYGGSEYASIDPLLDDDHGELGFKRRNDSLKGRQELGRFVFRSENKLSVADAVTEKHDLLRVAVIHLKTSKR